MAKRILIAQISTAHGIKGLVKLRYFGESIEDVEDYNPFYTSETGHDTLTLHIKNYNKNAYIAEIEGINDRNQAEALRNIELYIDEDKIPEPDEGEYLQKDLVGCEVIDHGKVIGKVIAVTDFGAGDLLDIKPISAESFYLPFTDEYVGEIDIKAKKINVSIPEGLLD